MEELKETITQEITMFMEHALDLIQVAVPADRWKPVRSKILRGGNDAIRKINRYIDDRQED